MPDDKVLEDLLERCRADHRSWVSGDGSPYALPENGSIMGAVGGHALGGPETASRQVAVAQQWRAGRGEVDFVNGAASGDIAWLAMIERATVEFTSDPVGIERRWDLRVTEIFRRIDGEWIRVHRHADPLVDRRPLEVVAKLLE